MFLGVGQVERAGAGSNRADQTLAETQLRQVDGVGIETDGRIELEHRVGAEHIERADFGHHVGGDIAHDPVEPFLWLEGLRHQFAEPFQKYARPGGHVTYHSPSPWLDPARHVLATPATR